jgi:hypothetical protein
VSNTIISHELETAHSSDQPKESHEVEINNGSSIGTLNVLVSGLKRKLTSETACPSQKPKVNGQDENVLSEYHGDKKKLAQTMRDFNNRLIVFLSVTDDRHINVDQYTLFNRKVRAHPTDRLSNYLKGTIRKYKLSTHQKKGICTENELFIPEFIKL